MVRLELGKEEADALREALDIYLQDFRRQVAGTENPDFRHALQRRQDVLEHVVQRLTAATRAA